MSVCFNCALSKLVYTYWWFTIRELKHFFTACLGRFFLKKQNCCALQGYKCDSSYSLKPTILIITNDLRPWFTIVYLRWLCERRLSRCSKVNSINKIKQKQKQKKNVVKTERFHRNELFWIGNSMKEESSRKKRKWRENSKYQELLMLWLSFLVLPLAHPLTPDIRGSKAGIELNTHFTLNERYKLS